MAEQGEEFVLPSIGCAQCLFARLQLAIRFLRQLSGMYRILEEVEGGAALVDRSLELDRLIGDRCEAAEALQQPQILPIELAMRIVTDGPNGAHGMAANAEGNEQPFFGKRRRRGEIRITVLPVGEEQGRIAVEHVAARPEIARGPAAEVRLPGSGDR